MTTSATDRTREAAATAADEGKHVADVARQEAQQVVAEAQAQVRNVMNDAISELSSQSVQQRDRLVETLRALGGDLENMASQSGASSLATDVTRQIAERCRELSSRLDGREPTEILDDVRSFARRRPGVFLLGALAAGVAAGRVARGVQAASSSGSGSQPASTTMSSSPGAGTPISGTPSIQAVPAAPAPPAPDPASAVSTPGYRTQDAPQGGPEGTIGGQVPPLRPGEGMQ